MIKPLFLFAAMLTGCSSSIPIPTEDDVRTFNTSGDSISVDELRANRELYITKCSGCHSLHVPSQFSKNEWALILPAMNLKSKLNTQESERIKQYLTLYSTKRTEHSR